MDNTIRSVSGEECTGCGACYNICPVGAIEMVQDSEGFLVPKIDSNQCVNCGLCLKTCPVPTPMYKNNTAPTCYAVMGDDDIRSVSSSGGVFSLLADWMFEQKGIVCGASYTDDCYGVIHKIATDYKMLDELRGSKYVQSNTGSIYREVKQYLENGISVLFTGTPCQIAAVNSFLNKTYSNLYTLDLVCHGVPSPSVFARFVQEQERGYGSKAVRISFRDKDIVNWDVSTAIDFENGTQYRMKRNECNYLKSFFKLLSLRKCCGKCQFATLPRQGDMTIADFWDIHRFNRALDDQKGTSLVLSNNKKGETMLEVLRERAVVCAEVPLEHGIKYNAQIKSSSVLHPRRYRFFDLLSTYHYDFTKAVDYGMNRRFDIGYVGWWYGTNYGSAMTNYALNRVLTDMGKTVLMLEWPVVSGEVPKDKPNNRTRRLVNRFYEQSMLNRIEDYGRFNYHCNTFIVGSDQLWNWWSNQDVGTYHFFLDFVDDSRKKIAYSTSFGHDSAYYPEEMRLKISYLLHRFDAISVRESGGVTVCRRDFGVDAVQTVDPVFLCRMKAYEEIIALSEVEIPGRYVLAYILNPTEEKINTVRLIAEELSMSYCIILDGQGDFEKLKSQANDPNVLENVEVADWLKYFYRASYIVTDSFHGFCYSVIFEKNVVVFPNKLRGLSRFESLCNMTDLHERMVQSSEEIVEKQLLKKDIDFAVVKAKMQPVIDYSRSWLKEVLEMKKLPLSSRTLELKTLLEISASLREIGKILNP